jgi:hypothetical protein
MRYRHSLLSGLLLAAACARIEPPAAVLIPYAVALTTRDHRGIVDAENSDNPSDILLLDEAFPTHSFRLLQRIVMDSAAAAGHNANPGGPRTQVGDVGLLVARTDRGRTTTRMFWLRRFGRQWRVYAREAAPR